MASVTPAAPPSLPTLAVFLLSIISAVMAKRHVVYWNSTNTGLTSGDLSIQVDINDYLDIYCPHYPDGEAAGGSAQPEMLGLYLVEEEAFRGCVETKGANKRWVCNDSYSPFGPARFSEKFQRFTPFSLGVEFHPGRRYYYSSLPADEGPPLPCMKLHVTVCCERSSEGSRQIQATAPPAQTFSSSSSSSSSSPSTRKAPPLLLLLLLLLFLRPITT